MTLYCTGIQKQQKTASVELLHTANNYMNTFITGHTLHSCRNT